MKQPPDYAELVARLLRRRIPKARQERPERDHGIGSVAQAMGERQRRRTRRRVLFGGGALGALCALAMFGNLQRQRDPMHGAREAPSPKWAADLVGHAHQHRYEPGSRIVAVGAPLNVEFGESTRLALEDRTEMLYDVLGTTRRFRLLRGAVRLRVAKLSAKDRFIVETPDAEVEVRGTEFEVRIEPDASRCTSPTRVNVFEGTVELRRSTESRRLSAGEHFAACREVAPSTREPSRARSVAPPALKRRKPASSGIASDAAAHPAASPADVSSSLAAQNALYARAVTAKRAGAPAEALRAFQELVTRFPGGPLEESATAERMRLLAKLDPPRARSEARHYLERFPRGFARDEALVLLGQR